MAYRLNWDEQMNLAEEFVNRCTHENKELNFKTMLWECRDCGKIGHHFKKGENNET